MGDLTKQLMACVELGKAVTSTLDREEILQIILNRLSQLIRAQNWTLYLMDEAQKELHFAVVVGLEGRDLRGIRLKVGEGLAGMVAETGEPLLVPDAGKEPHFDQRVDSQTGFTTHSLITLPLMLGEKMIGVLQIINPENQELFKDRFFPILQILSDFVAIAINNALNHEKMEKLVVTDDVSGYYNSRYLHQKLAEIIDSGQMTSLVFLEEDGHHVKVSASFGIANYPEDAQDLKGLLQSADISMYQSKDRGKNLITVS